MSDPYNCECYVINVFDATIECHEFYNNTSYDLFWQESTPTILFRSSTRESPVYVENVEIWHDGHPRQRTWYFTSFWTVNCYRKYTMCFVEFCIIDFGMVNLVNLYIVYEVILSLGCVSNIPKLCLFIKENKCINQNLFCCAVYLFISKIIFIEPIYEPLNEPC